jgi:hypothetical protein
MTGQPLSPRANRIRKAIDDWPRRRVTLGELRQLFDDADPESRISVHRRRLLAETLDELAAADAILLPSRHSYDRSEQPALPRFVTLPGSAEQQSVAAPVVWHPQLAWAADERVVPSHRRVLTHINRWLFHNRDDLVVPLRERSLEILGDEKALDRLFVTGLFGPGRLTLNLLKAKRVAPPMHTAQVGQGDLLLVVENSDTFDSIVAALRTDAGRVGAVGWGAGAAFEASMLSIPTDRYTDIAYFGDLDPKGLQIPANTSRLAMAIGLPPVRPAVGLYTALQETGITQPHSSRLGSAAVTDLVAWLAPQHRLWAAEMIGSGRRAAQESVGLRHVLRHSRWRIDLAQRGGVDRPGGSG